MSWTIKLTDFTVTVSDEDAAKLRRALELPTQPPTTPPEQPPEQPPFDPNTFDMGWGKGVATRDLPSGFYCERALAFRFVVPADYANMGIGAISWSEFDGPPTTRFVTISTKPHDYATMLTGAISGLGMLQWSINTAYATGDIALLEPGKTYYFNIRNTTHAGKLTCQPGRQCNAIILWSMPS